MRYPDLVMTNNQEREFLFKTSPKLDENAPSSKY